MTYAIIGSGAIGTALARQFARSNIDVSVANSRGPESLQGLVAELGSHVTPTTVPDALKASVVILAIPFTAIGEAVRGAAAWNGRIVVDATNAIDFPAFTPTDLGGRPSTELVAEMVSGARVVKAFNTLPAAVLASDSAQAGGRRVLFISGDDTSANAKIVGLIERLGFAPITLGPLAEGGLLQQFGTPLVAQNLVKHR
ncbi:NADPH-dependent F420 reductase [Microvirga roseola]|uniref:NADPH-dependent F420 reductase n=1 Tax=Microvirga roseola TaxID=2883126 RepID=UPI001E476FC9|nr:NADPH-dependent F420 reductase [Microvirga roseola]